MLTVRTIAILSPVWMLSHFLASASAQDNFDDSCLVDVSKDACRLVAKKGRWQVDTCIVNGQICREYKVQPFFFGKVTPNPNFGCFDPFFADPAGNAEPCDKWRLPDANEFTFLPRLILRLPEFPGILRAPGCVYRGVWTFVRIAGQKANSSWEIKDAVTKQVYGKGLTWGTAGSGTHRPVANCLTTDCERCYEVTVFCDTANKQCFARIHLEGFMKGRGDNDRDPDRIRECDVVFMLRGEMLVPLDPDTWEPLPPTPDTPWLLDANFDGELVCPCGDGAIDPAGD